MFRKYTVIIIIVFMICIYGIMMYINKLEYFEVDTLGGGTLGLNSEMPPLFDCQKYPELCYSKQYQNDKFRPYLFARKEYGSTLEKMRLENSTTYEQRLLDELARQNKIKEYQLWYEKLKKGNLVSWRECSRDYLLRRKCRTRHKYVGGF
jgi:hypothetical protein